MLLPIIDETLKQFDSDLTNILNEKYKDILIYGSVSINSFIPHHGDIDFIVILNDDLTEFEINKIYNLHEKYRKKDYSNLEYQLEGSYYPEAILLNINKIIIGCYIGTGRKGWKKIGTFQQNYIDLIQIKQNGISFKNKKYIIYEPSFQEVKQYILEEISKYEMLLNDSVIPSFVIIQFVARTVFYLEHNRIGSKKLSCEEFYEKYINDEFIKLCGIEGNYKELEIKFTNHKNVAANSLNKLSEIMDKKSPNVI